MKAKKRQSRMYRRDKWENRMALIGITAVVLSLAVVVNLKGASLRAKDLEYQIKEQNLEAQKAEE